VERLEHDVDGLATRRAGVGACEVRNKERPADNAEELDCSGPR
jgi:hypothetical protein